jgi:uncharacterized protein YecE (DUF72 family)
MLFRREKTAEILSHLAEQHRVYVGTSSWKYTGWCGTLYDEERYFYNHRFSKGSFERNCLEEYAGVFRTVCVDATYYRIPKARYLEGLASQVPDHFKLSFKVPDDITIKTFPSVSTFGSKAGDTNPDFLDHAIFTYAFLRTLELIREKVGMLIFEFSHFHETEFEHGRDFVHELDKFFSEIPKDWQYGVEIRNQNLLHPEYFAMLRRHGVAHIYNQWTHMPPISEQIGLEPLDSNVFAAARFLLTPGRPHQWAIDHMEPYHHIYEIDPAAREGMARMLGWLTARNGNDHLPAYLYVGNQLEGNALHTIADVLEGLVFP